MTAGVLRASGVGPWPGRDVREATITVRDLLLDGDGLGLPYLPLTPDRGPGADPVGRTAGLLVDLHVDLQPAGWRLVDRPGRDARRTAGLLREELDEAAAAYDGYAGALKVQVSGPWAMAAGLTLPRGERVLADEGACRDLTQSLAEGVAAYLSDLRRLVPGAQIVLQLDEHDLPTVLEGSLQTASGLGRLSAVDAQRAAMALSRVLAAHDGPVLVHCCHDRAPVPLLRAVLAHHGQGAIWLDTTTASPARWESLAATLETGVGVWCGSVPVNGQAGVVSTAVQTTLRGWERAGIALGTTGSSGLGEVGITPACGLSGLDAAAARVVQQAALDVARELCEQAGG